MLLQMRFQESIPVELSSTLRINLPKYILLYVIQESLAYYISQSQETYLILSAISGKLSRIVVFAWN